MNLLLLFPDEIDADGPTVVRGARARQLRHGVGVNVGDPIHVGRLDGPLGMAVVRALSDEEVVLDVSLANEAPPRPTTRLLMAIPRPKMLRRLLPQVVSFGLAEIVLLRTWRVQRSYLDTELLHPEVHRPLVLDGMMQACLTHEPRVRIERRFVEYVEGELELDPGLNIVLDPRADVTLAGLRSEGTGRSLAFGPEGGFIDAEVESLNRAGFTSASLCGPILKVETACIAGLAQLELLGAQQSAKYVSYHP